MIKFIQESLKELEHVVWPTSKETRKYVTYVIGAIVIVTVFLSVLTTIIGDSLHFTREQVQAAYPSTMATPSASGAQDAVTKGELDNLLKNIQVQTGVVNSGVVAPVATGSAQ